MLLLAQLIVETYNYHYIARRVVRDDDFSNQRCSNYVHQLQSKLLLNLLSNGAQERSRRQKDTTRTHYALEEQRKKRGGGGDKPERT